METPFSPLSFGKSFIKIRSVVPENGCLVFLWRTEKAEKTSVKHIRIRLIGGCVNNAIVSRRVASRRVAEANQDFPRRLVLRSSLHHHHHLVVVVAAAAASSEYRSSLAQDSLSPGVDQTVPGFNLDRD